jgi:predicted transcriptional regulator
MSGAETNQEFPVAKEERTERRREMAQALAKGGLNGVHVLTHESAREVLTPRRVELLHTIRDQEPDSVRELARESDRDHGQVSRDLETLATHALVAFETEGRRKRPIVSHDRVVIEPVL